jgi:NAD(P)H-dependent FMN reductase
MSLHIAILYGSVREARASIRVARFLEAALRRRGHAMQADAPAELHLPLLDRMFKEYQQGSAPLVLEALAGLYRKVDAFAIVSGNTITASYPA